VPVTNNYFPWHVNDSRHFPGLLLFFLLYFLLLKETQESKIVGSIARFEIILGTIFSLILIWSFKGLIADTFYYYVENSNFEWMLGISLDWAILILAGPCLLICGIGIQRLNETARKSAIVVNIISAILFSEFPNQMIARNHNWFVPIPAPALGNWMGAVFWVALLILFIKPIISLNRQGVKEQFIQHVDHKILFKGWNLKAQLLIVFLGLIAYSIVFYLNFEYTAIWFW